MIDCKSIITMDSLILIFFSKPQPLQSVRHLFLSSRMIYLFVYSFRFRFSVEKISSDSLSSVPQLITSVAIASYKNNYNTVDEVLKVQAIVCNGSNVAQREKWNLVFVCLYGGLHRIFCLCYYINSGSSCFLFFYVRYCCSENSEN